MATPNDDSATRNDDHDALGDDRATRNDDRVTPGSTHETSGSDHDAPGGERKTPGGKRKTPGGERETFGGDGETLDGERAASNGGRPASNSDRSDPSGDRLSWRQGRSTSDDPRPDDPVQRMHPTRPSTLVVAALSTAAVSWLLINALYGSMPNLPWLPPLTMVGLAVVEAVAARQTRLRIERRAGAGPVEPLLVARYVVLGKASALAGALFGGAYAGLTSWLLMQRGFLERAGDDLPPAAAGTVGSFVLLAAGLLLEHACRVPSPPDDDQNGSGHTGTDSGERRGGGPGR